jgi:2-O-methyltransferase
MSRDSIILKQKFKSLIKTESPTIFEIGANNGDDSQEFYEIFENPTLYCFEPGAEAIEKFKQKNLKAFLFEGAISDKDGTDFYYPSNNNGYSGGILKPTKYMDEVYPQVKFFSPIVVKIITLDTFVMINDIGVIDLVYADVQGAEEKMIMGGINTLFNKTRFLFTEYSETELYESAPSKKRILELLPMYELIEIVYEWLPYEGNMILRNKNLT